MGRQKYVAVGASQGGNSLLVEDHGVDPDTPYAGQGNAPDKDGSGRILGEHVAPAGKLDAKKRMKQMDIKTHGERAPTRTGLRRGIALGAIAVFLVVLLGSVVVENVVVDVREGLRGYHSRARNRRDVYLISFYNDGEPVLWNNTELTSSEPFAKAIVSELSRIPFRDFSLEFTVEELGERMRLAVVEEKGAKVDAKKQSCSKAQAAVISFAEEVAIERCDDGDARASNLSPLRHATKCFKYDADRQHAAEDEQLVAFWQRVMARAVPGVGFSTRCCDFDQVLANKNKDHLLEMCTVDTNALPSSGVPFFRYWGRKSVGTCQANICGCECVADNTPTNLAGAMGPSCPARPRNMDCTMVLDRLGGTKALSCATLPDAARTHEAYLKLAGVSFGTNARCFGKFASP